MSDVLEKFRDGVDHVKRHFVHKHDAAPPPVAAPALPNRVAGARSRTAAERREALARFRSGPGAKAEPTPEFEAHAEQIEEKLAGTHHNIMR